jgi:hypothetical protein
MEEPMRAYILAACLAAVFTLPAAATTPIDTGIGATVFPARGGDYGRGRWGYGPDCRELRRACLYKDELGEVGRGNCQRYRALCR